MVSHRHPIVPSSIAREEGENAAAEKRCPEIEQSHESLPIIGSPSHLLHFPCLRVVLAPVIWAQFTGQLTGLMAGERALPGKAYNAVYLSGKSDTVRGVSNWTRVSRSKPDSIH
jgi:hypothetical protein